MLTQFLTSKIFLAVVRHLLGLLAGAAVTNGYMDASLVDTLIGAGMGLATVGWSVIDKEAADKREAEALETIPIAMRTG